MPRSLCLPTASRIPRGKEMLALPIVKINVSISPPHALVGTDVIPIPPESNAIPIGIISIQHIDSALLKLTFLRLVMVKRVRETRKNNQTPGLHLDSIG